MAGAVPAPRVRKTKPGWKQDEERAKGERPSPELKGPGASPAETGLHAGIRRARTRPDYDR